MGNLIPGGINGRTFAYEKTTFAATEVLDVENDLGRKGVDGYIICDGAGDIYIEISDDGTNYGGRHTIKDEESVILTNLKVSKIRLTHSGTNSAYRIMVI